jgi:hypothetical protein
MIDINKKYRTRDGREVRIYATDGAQCGTCIHGAVLDNGWWGSVTWGSDGSKYSWREDDLDLIEVGSRAADRIKKLEAALKAIIDRAEYRIGHHVTDAVCALARKALEGKDD